MDTEKIKSIIKMFEESQISKMDLTDGDMHITLEKEMEPVEVVRKVKTAPIYHETETKEPQMQGTPMKSPLVGTYYQASGSNCIIEAMKVMNEIKATTGGTVLSINVNDGETVEYDQVLMMIG